VKSNSTLQTQMKSHVRCPTPSYGRAASCRVVMWRFHDKGFELNNVNSWSENHCGSITLEGSDTNMSLLGAVRLMFSFCHEKGRALWSCSRKNHRPLCEEKQRRANISVVKFLRRSQISVRNNNTLVFTIHFPVMLFIIKSRHPINIMSV
jgi:hypothetical protein